MKKKRADELLVEQNLLETKEEALSYIMSGKVFTNKEIKILTPGEKLKADTRLYIKGMEKKYVSRGGLKLEKALATFEIKLEDKIILDIGASTGGFTDVSLKNGAKKVYALDVGTNQLAWELRSHNQVIVMEQKNFRYSLPADFKEGQPDFATIDVSFISLGLIFPALYPILQKNGEVIALIKPQFEAKKEEVGEGGIVRDPAVYEDVLKKVIRMAKKEHFNLKGLTVSPIQGTKGNVEFLAYFSKKSFKEVNVDQLIRKLLIKEKII
ncbi:MAG: TlyA family RNA methyltransferase [Atopostipes suicloacalis]|nr:TlyA family RNA methyltransferase [Atopostipes suicloacalis]MDN6730917.1 TlyA family RNA methyltransferase [Atopostipes suicloacalis]